MAIPTAHSRGPASDLNSDCPRLIWALCTVARSGSTWLSQLVESTGLLGFPDEYLLQWPQWCVRFGLSASTPLEEYLSCLIRHRSTPNGVFAIKGSFAELKSFFRFFPNAPCVWLSRENKLEQAVSWHRAHDGGLWTRTQRAQSPRPFDFSVDRALWFYDEILRREAAWLDFFSSRDVSPLALTYEEICRDPLTAVRTIAAYVGVDATAIERIDSRLRIVRDEATVQLVRRAEQAIRARNAIGAGEA